MVEEALQVLLEDIISIAFGAFEEHVTKWECRHVKNPIP
jgi:hypothetical protein